MACTYFNGVWNLKGRSQSCVFRSLSFSLKCAMPNADKREREKLKLKNIWGVRRWWIGGLMRVLWVLVLLLLPGILVQVPSFSFFLYYVKSFHISDVILIL